MARAAASVRSRRIVRRALQMRAQKSFPTELSQARWVPSPIAVLAVVWALGCGSSGTTPAEVAPSDDAGAAGQGGASGNGGAGGAVTIDVGSYDLGPPVTSSGGAAGGAWSCQMLTG